MSHQIPEVKRRKGAINRATEATTERPPNDHRTTTNQNGQKEKNGQNVSSDLSATSADANADGASTVSSPQSEGRQSAGNRARPPLLDALAAVDGSNPREVTGPAWGGIAKALSAIKAAFPQVTPEEIARRAEAYRKLHPDWSLTPTALAKHWASCVPGAARYEGAARRPAPNIYVEPPNWREHAAAKWPGTELPEKWSDLSATLRNDLLNSRKQ